VGAEPAAGGTDLWFDYYDDTVVGDPCSEAEHAFLAALRARAVSHRWPCDPADTFSNHDDELGERALKVGVWLSDPVQRTALAAFGLVFYGDRIVGDRIDYVEPFAFEGLREAAMESAGSLESLAERAGEWFERLLAWPIERREWFDGRGELVYHEWVLSNLEEKLVVNASWPPARRPDRVVLVRGTRDRRTRAGQDRRGVMSWWRRKGGT
jgi:hypothetical protein